MTSSISGCAKAPSPSPLAVKQAIEPVCLTDAELKPMRRRNKLAIVKNNATGGYRCT